MKVKIYVDWEAREICKEEELESIKKDRVAEALAIPYDRRNYAYDFLDETNFSAVDLFVMEEEDRKELLTDFEKYVGECIVEGIKDEYEEIIIEV
jgi:hypothetical protein